MTTTPLTALRRLCLSLPEAHEVEAWGEPTFRVRKKMFVMFASATNHHGAGRDAAWIKAAPGEQEVLVRTDPAHFFVPPYVGPSGWVGAWLDNADWKHLADIIQDGYRLVAPRRLIARLDAP